MVAPIDLVTEAESTEHGILRAFGIDAEMSGRLIFMSEAVDRSLPNDR